MYEYSNEASNYGLVTISDGSVSELPDFGTLQKQYSANPNPQGDGGYNSTGGASGCPAYSSPNWLVQDDSLPAIPAGAVKYMSQGAGKGPGLSGAGSQNAGGASTGTASAGSGQPTVTSTPSTSGSGSSSTSSATSSSNAAASLMAREWSFAPWICGAVVAISTLFGAALL